MACTIGETNHFVLDRGAVTRSAPGDLPGIDRGMFEVVADELVAFFGGMGDTA